MSTCLQQSSFSASFEKDHRSRGFKNRPVLPDRSASRGRRIQRGAGTCVAPARRAIPQSSSGVSRMTPEPTHTADEVLRRVQGEFLEMPGLRLTEPQARRLWGLDSASCSALLGALVDAKFLFRTRDGAFMRQEQSAPVK